jgi:hypothetical protein
VGHVAGNARLLAGLAAAFAVCLVVTGSSSAASQGTFGALVEHWDGTAWTRVPVAGGDGLSAVVAVSATDVWAFGTSDIDKAVGVHWDGSAWHPVPMPVPQGTDEVELEGAAAGSSADVWVVGRWAGPTSGESYHSLIEHWDGSAWTVVRSPTPRRGLLFGVAVLSPANAWAVGDDYRQRTLILHWNGKKWKRVRSPNPSDPHARHFDSLAAVAAVSSHNVWAVGEYFHRGASGRHSFQTLVLHWNGKRWKRSPSPNPGGLGHENALDAVAADPSGHLWAAGWFRKGENGIPLVERRRSSGWLAVPAPSPPAVAPQLALASVAPLAADDVWTAGWYEDDALDFESRALVEHWDGQTWQVVPTPAPAPTDYEALFGIAAVSASDIWAVGAAGSS